MPHKSRTSTTCEHLTGLHPPAMYNDRFSNKYMSHKKRSSIGRKLLIVLHTPATYNDSGREIPNIYIYDNGWREWGEIFRANRFALVITRLPRCGESYWTPGGSRTTFSFAYISTVLRLSYCYNQVNKIMWLHLAKTLLRLVLIYLPLGINFRRRGHFGEWRRFIARVWVLQGSKACYVTVISGEIKSFLRQSLHVFNFIHLYFHFNPTYFPQEK